MKQESKDRQEKLFADAENMEQRYKNWANTLASMMALMVSVGQELCGEQFISRVENLLFENSRANAHKHKDAAGIKADEVPDCIALGKIFDRIDSYIFGNIGRKII